MELMLFVFTNLSSSPRFVSLQIMNSDRKIIHIDMDAFYAAVEQRDNPLLRGKPVAVGGSSKRGVVASASYEARKYGVRSAMPSITAKRICPELIFAKARFDVYQSVSKQIRAIFESYTDLVEPLSLDEAFLDVTYTKKGLPSGTLLAKAIRKEIFETTQLTASAGVSFNKFLAKVASDINKPNGQKVIPPEEAIAFLETLPIEKFFGIGKVTAARMHKMNIRTGADLKKMTLLELGQRFGKAGRFFYNIVRAKDDRAVNPNRIRKSLGAERTFFDDLTNVMDMKTKLRKIAEKVFDYMEAKDNFGRTLTLKVKSSDFKIITRSKTLTIDINSLELMNDLVDELLEKALTEIKAVRLLGITISNLSREHLGEGIQLEFDFEKK